eukprot:TRINITY_DN220_c0_g2_i1.p1 TRINITY_DN220_c0_g2~~TRINITY_DN220_c0_g2_i1.p1  ORF type:complete len:344 (-),score=82.79 TRINITY_DN220_c0_g2_i1:62-1093(-)
MRAVDEVEVIVLSDNVVDYQSSLPHLDGIRVELDGHKSSKRSGSTLCQASHGLSYLVTTWIGKDEKQTVLFDTGCDGSCLLRNAEKLGIDLSGVRECVLSHGHWDHFSGLTPVIMSNTGKGEDKYKEEDMDGVDDFSMVVHVHPRLLVRRRSGRGSDGKPTLHQIPPPPEELASLGCKVVSRNDSYLIANDTILVSGEIPRRTDYETGAPSNESLIHGVWVPDTDMIDERFLMIQIKGRGNLILSACSHAGIVNVMNYSKELSIKLDLPSSHVFGVMGGLHLAGGCEARIDQTVEDMLELGPSFVGAGHCTGWRAQVKLSVALGDRFFPTPVGSMFVFSASTS